MKTIIFFFAVAILSLLACKKFETKKSDEPNPNYLEILKFGDPMAQRAAFTILSSKEKMILWQTHLASEKENIPLVV